MLRRFRFAVAMVPMLAALLFPLPAAANTVVAVDCGDGGAMAGSVDLNTLTELEGAVQAMVDNPAGMTCSLGQPSMLDPLYNNNDPGSFVVGGGRYFAGGGTDCVINFSLSGHVDQNGVAHGSQTATEPGGPQNQPCGGQGHVNANVTCVAVNGNMGEVRGDIQQQTGSLGPQFFPPGDSVFVTIVQDNGKPHSGIPDRIQQQFDSAGTENNCAEDLALEGSPIFTVDNGNVSVHQGA